MYSTYSRIFVLLLAAIVSTGKAIAQFSPQATFAGSVAIYKEDSRFKSWADECTIILGWQNIADTTLGKVTVGNTFSAIGKADNAVLSLGDRGEAVLYFKNAIVNGNGADFAVFENGFLTGIGQDAFLELATVAVSEDGIHYVSFPATSLLPFDTQLAMQGTDCRWLHNLAGSFIAGYGTPFDLEELKDSLAVDNIHYVKITDVVGSINPQFATFDNANHPINDPFPTPFPSSGFDLDAVGVINSAIPNGIAAFSEDVNWYVKEDVLYFSSAVAGLSLYDLSGQKLFFSKNSMQQLSLAEYPKGMYIIAYLQNGVTNTLKIIR